MDSKLQIFSGRFKGRKLFLSADARPTQNRARQALFNILDSAGITDKESLIVWDAFAGSGAFGLECLSRYQKIQQVIFSDVSEKSITAIKKNLALLNMGPSAKVEKADAISLVSKYAGKADLIFVDPPYDLAELGINFIHSVGQTAKKDTVLIWEFEALQNFDLFFEDWSVIKDKKYGRARFVFLKRN